MSNTIGTAYIQIEPSTEGISGSISKALDNDATSAGASAGGKLSKALGAAASVGVSAIAGATAAVGAFGMSAINAGKDFDSSMAQVAATMGVTVDSIGELRDFAQEMGSTTAFSATEAADALNYMALAGYDAETSMETLPSVLNLASAGGIDLASASDMVTDALSALGKDSSYATTMVDQMAKTASKSNTSVAQLGEAILTVGGTAKNLSGGTVELSKVLGVLADNGIKGAEAGTHLRNIMLAMNPTTDKAKAAWKELGISAYDAEGNLRDVGFVMTELNSAMANMTDQEKTQTLTAMFNKTDLSAVNALLSTSTERYGELSRAINGASIDAGSFKKAFEGLGGSYEQLEASINALGDANLTYALPEYLSWSEGSAERLAQAMYEDADATTSYEDIVNALGGDLDILQQALDNTTGAAGAMADTQLDNLAGDITLFQSALEGAKIAVSDQLTPTLREFVQFGSDGLSQLTQAFNEGGLEGAMSAFGDLISQLVSKLVSMLPSLVNAGMQLLSAVGQGIMDNLPVLLQAAVDIVLNLANGIAQALPELLPAVVDILLSIVDTLLNNIDLIINAALNLIIGLANGLVDAIPKIIEKIPIIVQAMVKGLIENLPQILVAALQIIIALADGLIKSLPSLIMHIPEIIAAIVKGLIQGISEIKNAGKDLVGGLWEGIKSSWNDLINNVMNLGNKLVEKVKGLFKIGSPSKVFRDEIGQWIPAGIAVGIDGNLDPLEKSMGNIQSELSPDNLNTTSNISANYDVESNNDYSTIVSLLNTYLPTLGNQQIVLDSGALVGSTVSKYNAALGRLALRGANT